MKRTICTEVRLRHCITQRPLPHLQLEAQRGTQGPPDRLQGSARPPTLGGTRDLGFFIIGLLASSKLVFYYDLHQ
ncbi:hypothetical protein E2C01_015489 [Portunus trituberculatus]|uniref:Uncharacterized protein n=1 Tax=Portunus trituberculatus TaxID=210409 RepID=A0A5B7DN50_PORTR|nr:hypothetical protein [Portunus trituberculatus]